MSSGVSASRSALLQAPLGLFLRGGSCLPEFWSLPSMPVAEHIRAVAERMEAACRPPFDVSAVASPGHGSACFVQWRAGKLVPRLGSAALQPVVRGFLALVYASGASRNETMPKGALQLLLNTGECPQPAFSAIGHRRAMRHHCRQEKTGRRPHVLQ